MQTQRKPSILVQDCLWALTVPCLWIAGCQASEAPKPGWEGDIPGAGGLSTTNLVSSNKGSSTSNSSSSATNGGSTAAGGSSAGSLGGTSSSIACSAPATGARPHEAGNYDNRSCNATDCHNDMIGGGWVYASAKGPPWVGGATITITNSDGTTVTAISAEDGFFTITGTVLPNYKVCVSKCPGAACNLTTHPNADCQTSSCHGNPNQRVYVPNNAGGASGTGGTSSMGTNCSAPASGGPYTHTEYVFGLQPCSNSGCHSDSKPVFQGGFLYDGPTSTKTVAEATITLTPTNGETPITAVTGPDGMFFFGKVGSTSTATPLVAPYTACVSKCPLKLCSTKTTHTTTQDCQTSKCHDSEQKVYLK